MPRRSYLLSLCALALPAVVAAAPAHASETKLVSAVQLRTGPGDSYPDVKRLAKGLSVDVHGCLQTWDWCDVDWRGARGWVPARAVEFQREDRRLPLGRYGTTLNVPVVGFSLAKYWDAHYTRDPWYADRDRWLQRSARFESGGVMLENAVETSRRAPVATVPVAEVPSQPEVAQAPLSSPVSTTVSPPTTTTTTTTVITTTVTPAQPDF